MTEARFIRWTEIIFLNRSYCSISKLTEHVTWIKRDARGKRTGRIDVTENVSEFRTNIRLSRTSTRPFAFTMYIGSYRNFRSLSWTWIRLWSSHFYSRFFAFFTREREIFYYTYIENFSTISIQVQLMILSRFRSFKICTRLSRKYFRFPCGCVALINTN